MRSLFYILICFLPVFLSGQTTNISGTINSYVAVTSVGTQSVGVSSAAGFSVGDRVLIIQMKGATINTANTAGFGSITNYNDAGNYEFATVSSIAGTAINFSSPLLRTYTSTGYVQLVRVPTYVNANITGLLTGTAWNGTVGGIIVFEVSGTATLNADIDISAKGFRGGILQNGAFSSNVGDTSDYVLPSTTIASGQKGEGIVNPNTAMSNGKGAWANGGGAGNDCNGGGAGGGNYGLGGHGGDSKVNVSSPPYYYQQSGGNWGKNLNYSNAVNRIFLGGGGGAPHQNDGAGTPGTAGGGIVIIRAATITGNNHTIFCDGKDNLLMASIDGQGGGGAGGTVLLDACTITGLNVSAKGGKGGVDNFGGTDCHGKGGGGGGGVVWVSNSLLGVNATLTGGLPGVFTSSGSLCFNTSNGATQGQAGGTLTGLLIPGAVPLSSMPGQVIDTTVCTSVPVQLTATTSASYTWSTGSNTQSIGVTNSGTYWVQSYPPGSCQLVTDTFHVTLTTPPVVNNVLSDTGLCGNFIYNLDASSVGATSYNWSTGATSPSINVNTSGLYWVDMVVNNCAVRDSAMITAFSTPTVIATSYTVCTGQTATITPVVMGGTAPLTYSWSTGAVGQSYTTTPFSNSTYSVMVSDAHGCVSSVSSGSITVLPYISVAVAGLSTCTVDSISLTANVSGGDGTYSYTWTPSNSHQNPMKIPAPGGTTVYTVTVSDGCTSNTASDTALVSITPAPIISLPASVSGCAPVCIDLSNIPYSSLSSWQWNYGNGTYSTSQNGLYCYPTSGVFNISFSYTTSLGCVKTVTSPSMAVVYPLPVAEFSPTSLETDLLNSQVQFHNFSSGYVSSQWFLGDGATLTQTNPSHNYTEPGVYPVWLIVTNANGCIDSVMHEVTVYDIFTFYAPNSFSPNYDGDNDVFLPVGSAWLEGTFKLVVYDRWGNLIVSSTDPTKGWDGTIKGKEAQEDVYVWKAQVSDHFKQEHTYSGAIRLIK